jgi:hypothetical protein
VPPNASREIPVLSSFVSDLSSGHTKSFQNLRPIAGLSGKAITKASLSSPIRVKSRMARIPDNRRRFHSEYLQKPSEDDLKMFDPDAIFIRDENLKSKLANAVVRKQIRRGRPSKDRLFSSKNNSCFSPREGYCLNDE